MALGATSHISKINVNEASDLSSFKENLPVLDSSLRKTEIMRSESVEVKTLDSIWPSIKSHGSRIFLKLDTQGNEADIFEGALDSMPDIAAIMVELSPTAV
jgi:FkbM family methyltransferase